MFGHIGGVWLYSISDVDARVTASLCGGITNWESDMDTIIEVYQDSLEVICVGENDDQDSCTRYRSLITLDAVEREKYIALVGNYAQSKGTFTISVKCYQHRLEPSKDLSEEHSSLPSLSVSPSEYCTQEI